MTTTIADSGKRRSISSRIERVKSSCGVEAWLVEDHSRPLVSVAFAFKGGSALDVVPGSANLLAGLLVQGAGTLENEKFQLELAENGIELYLANDRDGIKGSMRVLKSEVPRAFELLAMALTTPQVSEDALKRQRMSEASMIAQRMSDGSTVALDKFKKRAFGSHSYGTSNEETLAALDTIGRADIIALHARVFTRSNVTVAVVGAIGATELAKLIDDTFSRLPEADAPVIAPCGLSGLGETIVTPLEAPQTAIWFGRPAIPLDHPHFYSASVLEHAFGGGFTSRLVTELREKRGLCYSVATFLDIATGLSTLMGTTSVPNEKAGEAVSLIKAEMEKLRRDGLHAGEIEETKGYLIGTTTMRLRSSAAVAAALLDAQLHDKSPNWLDEDIENIAAVSPESVRCAISEVLGDGSLLFSTAGTPT